MTIHELDRIFELVKILDADDPDDAAQFGDEVFEPVYEAIKQRDVVTLEYIEKLAPELRREVLPAIEDGMRDGGMINEGIVVNGYDRIGRLFRAICEENNLDCDEILQG